VSYHYTGLGASAEECLEQVKASNLDTAAGREQAAKTTAACVADGYCAANGVPPGPCGFIASNVVGAIVSVWNSLWGDDAHERAVLQAQTVVPSAYSQLRKLDQKFLAAYENAASRLIDLNDKLLVFQKGALGGGASSTVWLKGETKYIAAYSFSYKYYPNNCKAVALLVKYGAPAPVQAAAGATWCRAPSLLTLYGAWAQTHATADSIAQLKTIQSFLGTYSQWMLALSLAEVGARTEIEGMAAKASTNMALLVQLTATQPMGPVAKTVVVAGAAGLLWWAGKKLLF
jgi:hypothetical protein